MGDSELDSGKIVPNSAALARIEENEALQESQDEKTLSRNFIPAGVRDSLCGSRPGCECRTRAAAEAVRCGCGREAAKIYRANFNGERDVARSEVRE